MADVSAHEVVLPDEVDRLRRAATVILVTVAPFLLAGAALTVSVNGAILGVPVLAVAIPTARTAWRVRQRPEDARRRRRAFVCGLLFASAFVVAVALASVAGWDDLDSAVDLSGYVLAVIGASAAVWSVYVLWPTVELSAE
jgi:4-hydroxybenzoate polyprenyltransferase